MGNRGTLLFETFVALMILSVGVASTLKIFSQALFVGTRNEEKQEATSELNHLLFEWFAHPGGVMLAENGTLTLPFEGGGEADEYSVEISSRTMRQDPEATEAEEKIHLLKASQYYHVKCRVNNERRNGILELDTVVFRRKGV